jgi:hypothetical protein
MGSRFICEKAAGEPPKSAAATWKDNGDIYFLRAATHEEPFSAEKKTTRGCHLISWNVFIRMGNRHKCDLQGKDMV